MATFYIQLEDRLQKISGDLTRDNIISALGYTPSDFSGNFNDLIDNPFTQDDNGEFKIVDENGNIIAIVNNEGIHSIDFVAGDHKLSDKADKSYVDNKVDSIDIPEQDFNLLQNNPFVEDENGALTITDENGNIGFQLNSDGIYVKDIIAGDNVLSNKVDKVDGKELSSEDFTSEFKNKLIQVNVFAKDVGEELDDVESGNYVQYTVQVLTEEQKKQVRENLGIPSVEYVLSLFEELRQMIQNNNPSDALAVLDQAILDMHKLQ